MAIVKTNMQGYVKDTETGAVTNVNKEALQEHKGKVAKAKEIKSLIAKVNDLEERIKQLEIRTLPISTPHYGSIFPFAEYNAGTLLCETEQTSGGILNGI